MAQKEATVFIVDLGHSMGAKHHGRKKSDLDWAMEFVWDKITTTVSTGRKTALMGVVGCRTDGTDLRGLMDEEDAEGYSNITVLDSLKQFLLRDIRDLQARIKPSRTNNGDLFSAIALAIAMIAEGTKNARGELLKYTRKIYVVTDGRGYLDTTGLEGIVSKLKKTEIKITLLGVDFDEPGSGYKEQDKDPDKEKNEATLKKFIEDDCGGRFGTVADAIARLVIPPTKDTRPVPNYKGTLTLGDNETFEESVTIDVERYPCTMVAKPPSASSFVARTDLGPEPGASTQSSATIKVENHQASGQLAAVRNQRVYQVDNPDEPGVKMNVEPDELERGYEYGRTAVHISEADQTVVKLETSQSLAIIGFVPDDKFERYLAMSRTNYILPQKANMQAQLALSSFIHALWEGGFYAIARLVVKDGKPPVIVLLAPRIEGDFEALVDVELPFEEDMRRYKFPPLDRKLTVSGKTITEHRDLPNTDLMNAMSKYVDAMDLSTLGQDDSGEPCEYMTFEDTYSPLLHRINHIIRWRATNEVYDKLPDPPEILLKYSAAPPELIESTEKQLNALKAAGDVKRVPPKQKGRGKRRREDRDKPLSGLDIDELLGNPKRVKIEAQNLIPSFKQALAATDDLDAIQSAADDMAKHIRDYINSSVGESGYGRALEAIRVMREEITELEEADIYNAFIRALKRDILDGKLGGERREMWWRIRGSRYGLIDRKRSMASDVTEEEGAEFYKS